MGITGSGGSRELSSKPKTTRFTGFVKDFPKDEPTKKPSPGKTFGVFVDPHTEQPRVIPTGSRSGRGGGGSGRSSQVTPQAVQKERIIPIVIRKRKIPIDTSRVSRARRLSTRQKQFERFSAKQRQIAKRKRIVAPFKKRRIKRPLSFDVFGKSGNRFIKLNKGSLTKNDALSKGAFIIDNTISRVFKIAPSKSKRILSLRRGEKNYFKRKRFKLRKITRGERFTLKKKYLERKKYKKDTRGEKKKLTINKLLKRRR